MGTYVRSNLIKGERVVYEAKPHWITFISFRGLFTLFIAPLIDYFTNEYAITNKRIIIKVGFISRRTLEMNLSKIESVNVDQSILGRILGYGTIRVFGAGSGRQSFPKISTPMEFRKQFQRLSEGDGIPVVAAYEQTNIKPPRRIQVDSYVPPPPALDTPRSILLCISGPLQGRQFPVDKKVYHIGASSKNDLVIAKDDYVSRNHAYLRYEQGSLWLTDQRSRNGTFLNKNRLKDAPLIVNIGDRIRLGNSTFEVIRARGR